MSLWQDLQHSVRALRKSPGFTTVAILSLALGIGANTAIFSILDAVLLRALPVREPSALVLFGPGDWAGIWGGVPGSDSAQLFSYPFFQEVRERNEVFSDVLAVHSMSTRVHLRAAGQLPRDSGSASAQLVSGNYFSMLGIRPELGRLLSDADNRAEGAHPVVVVSNTYWRKRFGSDPAIVGQSINVNKSVFTIIGVAPPEFFGTTVGESPDLWFPLMMQSQVAPQFPPLENGRLQSLHLIGRLRPGTSLKRAQANLMVLYRQFWNNLLGPQQNASNRKAVLGAHITLISAARGLSHLRTQFSFALRLLMVIVGLVLLIACANLANLMLARSTARHREIAVRLALGASRRDILSHTLTETLTLSLLGGGFGVFFAWWSSRILLHFVASDPAGIPVDTAPNGHVLLFTLAVSLLTGLLFGLFPALRAARITPGRELQDAGRGLNLAASRGAFSRILVVAQVALSVILLTGAALFVRSLSNLRSVHTGFDRKHAYLFELDTQAGGYKQDQQLIGALRRVEDRIEALPGVTSASFSVFVFNQGSWIMPFWKPGSHHTRENAQEVHINAVTDKYFASLGLRLRRGRGFGPQDTAQSPKVGILSESGARILFGQENPVGKLLLPPGETPNSAPGAPIEIIGVVQDAKYNDVREQAQVMCYFPLTQSVQFPANLIVNVKGDGRFLIPAIRRAAAQADPNLPLGRVATLAETVDQSLNKERLVSVLSASFGLLALVLAAIGLYGVLSYSVQRRTGEIGIRMALGARPGSVLWLVAREGMALVLVGLLIGLPAATLASRAAASLLFGLSPGDPIALFLAAAVLLLTAAIATAVPVRRATRIDPLSAFRYD